MTDKSEASREQVEQAVRDGGQKWDAMSDEQKQKASDALPEEQKHNKTYLEWIKDGYHRQYENWMPWIEDQYLKWSTKDNKASHTTKNTLDKSKVTGIDQVDQVQDSVHSVAAAQVGQGGLLQPLGDAASKEGVNRAERGGKDNSGSYGGSAAGFTDPIVKNARSGMGSMTSGAKTASDSVSGLFNRSGGKENEGGKGN